MAGLRLAGLYSKILKEYEQEMVDIEVNTPYKEKKTVRKSAWSPCLFAGLYLTIYCIQVHLPAVVDAEHERLQHKGHNDIHNNLEKNKSIKMLK